MREINKDDLLFSKSGNIDWIAMIGKKIRFVYDEIESYLIIDEMLNSKKAIISGEFNSNFEIKKLDIRDCNLHRFLKISTREYKYSIGDTVNGLRIVGYSRLRHGKYMEKGYTVECVVDKYRYDVFESNITKGIGCGVCNGKICVEGVNDIATTNPDVVKYFKNKEESTKNLKGSRKYIDAICDICGEERKIMIVQLTRDGFSCGTCGLSGTYPNRFMSNVLTLLGVSFKKEYPPSWAIDENGIQRRYDFYIPSKKLIIEMDGGWHYSDNNITGQTVEESKRIDEWKDAVAKSNGLEVIRIDSSVSDMTYIRENMSFVNFPYTVSDYVFKEADRMSRSNLLKEVCDVYNETNGGMSNNDIGRLFHVSRAKVLMLLKVGNDIGMCEYNPRKTIDRCLSMAQNANKRKIEIFKDGVSLGVYESAKHIEEISVSKFGIQIKSRSIPPVCKGDRKHHKGFTFKYVE